MSKKSTKNLRAKTDAELQAELRTLKQQAFDLRVQQATGQLENNQSLHAVRKDIARTLTILSQRAAQ